MDKIFGNLETFGISIAIIIGTFIIASFVSKAFKRYIRYATEVLQNDPTNYQFLRHSLTALIYIIGLSWALFILPGFKAIAGSILTGAGILAVAAGVASQHALGNIMSGIFIIIFKPFRVNDRLSIRDHLNGIVEDITLRHTVIRDFENKRIIVPNTVISNEIIVNSDFSSQNIVKWIDIGISFDSNVQKAKQIMVEEVKSHPLNLDARTDQEKKEGVPEVQVRVISLGQYAVNIRAWARASNAANGFILSCDLLESIKLRFDQEGIEIPYPHHTIIKKKSLSANSTSEEA